MAVYINHEKARGELFKLTGAAFSTPLCAMILDCVLHGLGILAADFMIRLALAIAFFYAGHLSFNHSVNIMYNLDEELLGNEAL